MFVEICEKNNIKYLQKLIYTETMQQYLHPSILHTKLSLTRF